VSNNEPRKHGEIFLHGKNAPLIDNVLTVTVGEFWDRHSGENSLLLSKLPTETKQFSEDNGAIALEWHLSAQCASFSIFYSDTLLLLYIHSI